MAVDHFVQRIERRIEHGGLARIDVAHRMHAADFVPNPAQHERHHVDREHGRRVVVRPMLDVRAEIEHRRQRVRNALEQRAPDDRDRHAGRPEILLRVRVDHAVRAHVERPRHEIRRHVRDQRAAGQIRRVGKLQPFDGLVGYVVTKRRARVPVERGERRQRPVAARRAVPDHAHRGHARRLADRLAAPVARRHVLGRGRARPREIHRDHRELQAAAALQEHDAVLVWNAQQIAQIRLRLREQTREPARAMAHAEHRQAGFRQLHHRLPHLFEHGIRQRAGAAGEIQLIAMHLTTLPRQGENRNRITSADSPRTDASRPA